MKKKDRKALSRYIRWIADEMGLRDWHFEVYFEKPKLKDQDDAICIASCKPTVGRKIAELVIDPMIRKADSEDIRQTIVHELVHCHFFGMWDSIRRDLLSQMSQDSYDLFTSNVERHMEYGVDAVADAIAKGMPLINWKKK